MRIAMMTNTYLPHVGGVARSIERFTRVYRELGHQVLIVAPEFENQPADEENVIRLAALQNFNGSDFSVVLPIPSGLSAQIDEFRPDIIHSHHPFLVGLAAMRLAAYYQLPLVFTHHTLYEHYTHYVPVDAPRMREAVIALVTSYANLCTHVFAPSESVRKLLEKRGVSTPIDVVPTGVDIDQFQHGDGTRIRRRFDIPEDAFVVGHVGRLAPEKNLEFLSDAVFEFLNDNRSAVFLVTGSGPSAEKIRARAASEGLDDRVVLTGNMSGQDLTDSYHAMDVFVFASQSETQGMVLIEAMAACVPVIAVDASGVREVVDDNRNGYLLDRNSDTRAFAKALLQYAELSEDERAVLRDGAAKTADEHSTERCARKALDLYDDIRGRFDESTEFDDSAWQGIVRTVQKEWNLWTDRVALAKSLLLDQPVSESAGDEEPG